MKRSVAVGHLVEMSEAATERMRLRSTEVGWPLEELWVTGELLEPVDTLDTGSVVLVIDEPPDQMPWMALNPTGEWVGEQLRLGKRPLRWCYRPLAWPVWNHEHQRLLRFWSARDGLDEDAVEGLRARRLNPRSIVEPSTDDLVTQLGEELIVSRRHLKTILADYWKQDWRRRHKGFEESPEDHLWRAASAVEAISDALADLTGA